MNFENLIKSGESETLEFKQGFSREAIEAAAAFANTKGGTIIIGVKDNGQIVGMPIGKDTLIDWRNQISQSTEPAIYPEIDEIEIHVKTIIQIVIKEYPLKPISFRGRCFRRVRNSNNQMTPSEIAEMHLQSTGNSWDALPARDTTPADIDPDKIKEFIQQSLATGRRKFKADEDLTEILTKLELIKKSQPTWASVLLFGKNPQSPLTQAMVHCGRFKGETIIIDDRLISGSIIQQVDEAMDFIRKNINVEFRITGKPQREEIWDYPLDALREAVINAICHRDYSKLADIQIKIYDDFIQIWNPGFLPFGMTIDDLYDPHHPSMPRNKLIAQTFYDMGLIERYGSGIHRMIDACKEMKIPEPEFQEKFGGFMITFRKDIFSENYLANLGFNKRQIEAIKIIKQKNEITNKEYSEIFKVADRTALNDLTKMVLENIIERIGTTGRSTKYRLKTQFKSKPDKPEINPK